MKFPRFWADSGFGELRNYRVDTIQLDNPASGEAVHFTLEISPS
ncbi:hypothetical protein CLV31_1032 [Algoriphagus aquaeductus]|uniref:Uncharacterized protein n=1 Tax=Algoriphagus aquaeductus TaxID=475299 RepID=A0A326RVD7_9BACT|nr:hypothetical protein CLV31_1032 [Algoriphagus aquaeductus]